MSEQENINIAALQYQIREWRTLIKRFLPPTTCDRDDVESIAIVIEQLKQREAELMAHVEELKNNAIYVLSDYSCAIDSMEFEDEAEESRELANDLRETIDKTPPQSLSDRDQAQQLIGARKMQEACIDALWNSGSFYEGHDYSDVIRNLKPEEVVKDD